SIPHHVPDRKIELGKRDAQGLRHGHPRADETAIVAGAGCTGEEHRPFALPPSAFGSFPRKRGKRIKSEAALSLPPLAGDERGFRVPQERARECQPACRPDRWRSLALVLPPLAGEGGEAGWG